MYLVDQAKAGHPLPAKLPPELIPPSQRRGRAAAGQPAVTSPPAAAPGQPTPVPPAQQQGRCCHLVIIYSTTSWICDKLVIPTSLLNNGL